MKNKRLVHTRAVREAETMLAEALARKPGGKRPLTPGMLVRYWFHGSDGDPPEARLFQGFDVVELLRNKEPRVYLQRMKRWVFGNTCMIVPKDACYQRRMDRHKEQLAEQAKELA